jgi:hypothetical protein
MSDEPIDVHQSDEDAVLVAALAAYDAGLCPIRPRADGTKAPLAVAGHGTLDPATGKRRPGWELYQSERPDRSQVEEWFGGHPGLGLVCGEVSGNLEMLELEGRAIAEGVFEQLSDAVAAAELTPVVRRIMRGYTEETPSGGLHWLFYVGDAPALGSLKLAQRLATPDEFAQRPGSPIRALIETKAEGGFVIVAPSNGTVHPTGKAWTLSHGGFGTIATITVDERDALYAVCRSLDRVERSAEGIAKIPPTGSAGRQRYEGGTVGGSWMDATEAHLAATDSMAAALERYGWRDLGRTDSQGCPCYERPDQEHTGQTGAVINASGRLAVFSTSTPFESVLTSGHTYNLLDVCAAYEHGGDRQAAARAIAEQTGIYTAWQQAEQGRVNTMFGSQPPPPPPEWSEPIPLRSHPQLPAFPDHHLGEWVGPFTRSVAHATQTPIDLAAMTALASLAVAAGGKAVIEIRPGWVEPVNLFTATAMPPGARKSAVVTAYARPFLTYQRDAKPGVRVEIIEKEALKKAAAGALSKLMRPDKDGKTASDAEIKAAAVLADGIEVPVYPRLLADDATPEALASLMMEQKGRIGVLSAEGDVFDLMAGRYNSGESNLGIYLKGHSGDAHYLDRKGREPEFIERPALTLGMAVQPSVLREIGQQRKFRGRGLLARFLYSVPLDLVGTRDANAMPVDAVISARYLGRMDALIKAMIDWTDPMVLTLTAESREAVVAFLIRLEDRLRPDADLGSSPLLREWASKLVGQSVRAAGLLHLADYLSDAHRHAIEARTVVGAIAIAEEYCIPHARAAFDLMGHEPATADAEAVLAWIIGGQLDEFSKRDVLNSHRARFPTADAIDAPMALLEDLGWVQTKPSDRSGPGRRPSRIFLVNPYAHSAHSAQ